jgi:hypothetical protein
MRDDRFERGEVGVDVADDRDAHACYPFAPKRGAEW